MTAPFHRKNTAAHEGGHAALLVMCGRLPTRVEANHAELGIWGRVEIAWHGEELDRDAVADLILAIHAGPLYAGATGWPPKWPPDLGADGDEGQLAACVNYLGYDRSDADTAFVRAAALTATKEFNQLAALIARALELAGELDADELRELIGERRLERYGISPPQHNNNEKGQTT